MFFFETINNKRILKSDLFEDREVKHLFTTRESVVTPKDLRELKKSCEENITLIAKYLDIEPQNIIMPVQTHSDHISVAKKGCSYPDTDSLIIEDKNIAILLNFADCTPVILYDTKNNIGAVTHAGWKGTAASIVTKTVIKMRELYSTEASDIKAVIGPSISSENYQVDKPVVEAVTATLKQKYEDYCFANKNNEKYNLDLKTVNKHQLEELGVRRIDMCNYCTYDSVDVFFSYRKEHGQTARHSAILALK